nr:diacylglycerol kinase family lipid kinase [Alkalicoccus halolimnae]
MNCYGLKTDNFNILIRILSEVPIMIKRGAVVYNDKAGNEDHEKLLEDIKEILDPEVEELHFIAREHPGKIQEYLQDEENQWDQVWIMGGDGTVHTCIDGLRKRGNKPVTAIIPAGTCNDFARSLNLPMDPLAAVRASLEGTVYWTDIGVCNGHAFTNFAGMGIIADTSENIDEEVKERMGRFSYFMSAWKTMKDAETFSYSMTIDGHQREGEAVMILVCNGGSIGTTKIPFPTIKMDDGMLDLIIMKGTGGELFREWLHRSSKNGQVENTQGVTHMQVKTVNLKTNPVKKVDADGEVETETPAEIGIIPKAVPFIYANE